MIVPRSSCRTLGFPLGIFLASTMFCLVTALQAQTAAPAPPHNFVVTTAVDDATGIPANCPAGGPSDGNGINCSLRDAIAAAAAAGAGNINFSPVVFGANRPASARTIMLNSALAIPSNTQIIGPTVGEGINQKSLVTLNATFDFPSSNGVLVIAQNVVKSSISWLTVTTDLSQFAPEGIYNQGELTIVGLTVSGFDTFEVGGGGITNFGTLIVIASTISGNFVETETSGNTAGGIFNEATGTLLVLNSTISSNIASSVGGIENDGTALIVNSTVTGNSSGFFDGGILNTGNATLTIADSTISGNTPGFESVGGVDNFGTFKITNSILAQNVTDCSGTGCPANGDNGNIVGINPRLAPLGNYGGPTQTMLPLPGSPAICAGVIADIPEGVFTDQRGLPRISRDHSHSCLDSGSVQTQ